MVRLTQLCVQEVSTLNQYEAMFLFDPTFATDFAKAKEEVERVMQRAEAEIVFLEKWEERKLAYEIKGRKRGCYVLTYFKCDSDKIVGIERDAQLSEPILRILVKTADGVTPEHIAKFMPQNRIADDDINDESIDDEQLSGSDKDDDTSDMDNSQQEEVTSASDTPDKD